MSTILTYFVDLVNKIVTPPPSPSIDKEDGFGNRLPHDFWLCSVEKGVAAPPTAIKVKR